MALWNKVLSGFNADDETVNFGARTVAENNGSIFETSTLATIQSEGQVFANPNVSASIQYSMLCVAVDKSITIFSDETCHEIILSVGFDSLITAYCMSKDGYFVFVALASGIFHCLHIPSGGKQVFDENIEEKFGDGIVKVFLRDRAQGIDIIIVTASGVILGIEEFDMKLVHSTLIDQDDGRLNEIVQQIEFIKMMEGSKTTQAAMSVDLRYSLGQSSIVSFGKNIHLWPSDRHCGHLGSLPFEYTKVQFFDKYGAMICLRDDGFLSIVCSETLLGMKIWSVPVADFVTVEDEINDPYQLVVLTVAEKEAPTTLLQFLSFPDFKCKFQISVPTTTYLVQLVGCSVENIVFLEGIKNSSKNIEMIRVKAIIENKPEYRLERLLRRGQFEEAEFFAKQYQLSLDSVNAAKAAAFINQLGPWINGTNDTENFDKFISTLDKINDVNYIYDCCNNALTSNYKQTRRLVLYARQRITRHIQECNSQHFASLLSALNGNLRKLETFELIRKIKIDVEQSETEDVEEWITFSRANLLKECVKHLSLGELEAAAAIWIRHLPELAPVTTPSTISDILNSISETIDPCKLWPWLSHFVPSVISLLPGGLREIILWGYKKTRLLEKYNRKEWPQIGLDFARCLIDMLSFQDTDTFFNFNQQYTSKDSHLDRLMTLVQAMTDLLELKTFHRIVLPLETYLDDPANVVHLLLDKAHVEAIPSLIETFLERYMLNNSLRNDQIFSSYVQKTLRNSKSWWFWEKAPWERRVSIVIQHIHDVQNRLQQIVDVLKKAPVPWSDTIVALAEVSYNFDHPLVSKIRTESNGVTVKLILKKYGYAHVGLCTKLFRFIIKQDRKDMIADICEITKADNAMKTRAFCFCTNHHLNIGNIDRAMEVLRHVDDDIGQYCCQQIICLTIAGLRYNRRDERLAYYIEALGPVEVKLRKILERRSDSAVESNDSLKNIPNLKRIYELDKQFNVWISHENYYTGKKQVLESYVDRLVSDLENEKKSLLVCCEYLEKVSNLLGLSPLASVLMFFDQTKDINILRRSITRMARNGITSRDESCHLNQLCKAWITNADLDPEISMLLIKLCVWNFVNCDSDLLRDAVLCHNQVTAYLDGIGYEVTYKPETEQGIMNFNNHSYTIYTIYKDAAVSSGNMLLPLFRDSLKITNFYADGRLDDKDSASEREIELLVKSLMERAKKIQNEHHSYSVLRITKNVHYSATALVSVEPAVMVETRAVLSYCLYTLLRKVVGARSLDVCLGLACLFMLTKQEATKWLTAASRSFQEDLVRHRQVVNLGCEYFRITNHDAQSHTFDRQKLLHRWGRRLTEYGISYKEMLVSDTIQKRDILERVMRSGRSNLISLLEEFCQDFGFNKNDCFLLYLQELFNSWQPRLNFATIAGRKELKINESDVCDLNSRCKQVAAKINDKALMKRHLTQLSPQINFYHYEVFLTMLELVGENNVERIQHFCFLQNYTRYGRPTEFEREAWACLCIDSSSIPPISQWRLPFLPKIDQFKLITPELNLKTYEKWLSIAPTLKIQSHVICTLAIKGSVTEAWESYINDENRCQVWSLYPRNSGLLKDIKKCIKCMGGPEGLYYGTAALYFVVNHTPQGADQVAAAQECFASAQLWEQQSNESDEAHEAMIIKVKDKYIRLTSKHILHTHGVGDDKYLNLIGNPEKLIRELYNDESIPQRWRGAIQHRPDINSAANALGRLFSINMTTMRYDLLLEWLRSETWDGKHNDSMTMGFGDTTSNTDVNPIEEDNLLRACYILESGDTKLHVKFLIDIGFQSEKDDGYGAGIRFRALRVVGSAMDENTLKQLTKHDPTSFGRYMKSLQYLNELERLGLAYSVDSFESCTKHKLAQILLKTQFFTPRALCLILQICIDYGIDDHSLLNSTLEQMVKQSMAKELEKFLPVIGTTSTTINCRGYTSGWQVVIANPFEKLDRRPTPKQIADCIGSLRLLHACPVISKLKFEGIIMRCIQCRQAHLAAAFLPFLNDKDKDYVLQEMEKNFNLTTVIQDLIGLTPKGILVVSQCLVILGAISGTAATKRQTT